MNSCLKLENGDSKLIIAFLFNWRSYPCDANYWEIIRDTVFAPGILQRSGRHMKLSIGDVLVGLEHDQDAEALFFAAFANSDWRLVDENRLTDGFPSIFGMVFENMPRALASELNEALLPHAGFLGALSVHFVYGPHLALYRSRLPLQYRLQGTTLRRFFSMGEKDGCDPSELEDMRRLGYTDLAFEDSGMTGTIFDDFDTRRQFERVAAFRDLLLNTLNGNEDDIYQLSMMLEDLSPKLFYSLGAAANRLTNAEDQEEVAQVAISGRRYMEQLADALFPPTNTPRENRRLDRAAYRNRLWAFVEDHTANDSSRLKKIGNEIDRIAGELNSAIHSDHSKEQVASLIGDAAILTANLFSLAPETIRNGYLAYMESFLAFVRELTERDGSTGPT